MDQVIIKNSNDGIAKASVELEEEIKAEIEEQDPSNPEKAIAENMQQDG